MTAHPADRQAALDIVRTLRRAGHEAWFVGGCVRDELLGRTPREFDVATSAHPEQVIALFRRTVSVGAQFGVVIVVTRGGEVEVATFRSDGAYVDGRRPTEVVYSDPLQDAQRRDFTVNGLFLDPETGEVLDLVGGRADLAAQVIRAIGDPVARFREDKLRMLRAVRFVATHGMTLDKATRAAIEEHAAEIRVVSWERIQAELARILLSGRSAVGMGLLAEVGLLRPILPELSDRAGFELTLRRLSVLDDEPDPSLELALAVLFLALGPATAGDDPDGTDGLAAEQAADVLRRLRCPGDVVRDVAELIRTRSAVDRLGSWRPAWGIRFVSGRLVDEQLRLHRIARVAAGGELAEYHAAVARRDAVRAAPPPPLGMVTGADLLEAGHVPGPRIGVALAALADEILEGRVTTREEGLAWLARSFPPE